MTDAKIICMVDDLGRNALLAVLNYPVVIASDEYLRGAVLARLESGLVAENDIVMAWEEDTSEADENDY